jgi:hypothetical protein
MKILPLMLICALIQGTSYASQPKAKHPAARIPTPSTVRNTNVVHPSAPVRSAGAINQGAIQHHNVSVSNTSLPRIVVRHRGPNPAVVGGAATSNAKNTAAVSGTRMNPRHY